MAAGPGRVTLPPGFRAKRPGQPTGMRAYNRATSPLKRADLANWTGQVAQHAGRTRSACREGRRDRRSRAGGQGLIPVISRCAENRRPPAGLVALRRPVRVKISQGDGGSRPLPPSARDDPRRVARCCRKLGGKLQERASQRTGAAGQPRTASPTPSLPSRPDNRRGEVSKAPGSGPKLHDHRRDVRPPGDHATLSGQNRVRGARGRWRRPSRRPGSGPNMHDHRQGVRLPGDHAASSRGDTVDSHPSRRPG
jgi:hypothetical protein